MENTGPTGLYEQSNMKQLIQLIKEKVIRENMNVDETIKYVLELKVEVESLKEEKER